MLGIAKAAQLNTALLCTVWPRRQSFQLKLFTKSGLEPSETVKIYLDLMDLLPERGLMDMWVSNFEPLPVNMHPEAVVGTDGEESMIILLVLIWPLTK